MEKVKVTMYRDWRFWASMGAGVITGSVVGLLYAPTNGADLRRRAGETAANVAVGASNAANRIASVAQSGVDLYETSAGPARFQVVRFFKAVSAGINEAAMVRDEKI